MVLTLVLLPAVAGALGGTGGTSLADRLADGNLWLSLALTIGKIALFVAAMLIVGRRVIPWLLEKVAFTGNKRQAKTYHWHTGFPGGIKERKAHQLLDGKFPERVLELAVKRMLPGGPLKRQQMSNLRIYKGTEHPHVAQNPEKLDIASRNPKNTLRG